MVSNIPASFAELLRHERTKGGWSRIEIADAAGISEQFVAYLESGERNPSNGTIERLIIAMDLPPRSAGLFRRVAAAQR